MKLAAATKTSVRRLKSKLSATAIPPEVFTITVAVFVLGVAYLNLSSFTSGVLLFILAWLHHILVETSVIHSTQVLYCLHWCRHHDGPATDAAL